MSAQKNHYDAIIVGARVAGAPTAMLLARKGYHVLLVDRASFPSDTMSTHMLQLSGVSRLNRWGLLERLHATDLTPSTKLTLDMGPLVLSGTPPAIDGIAAIYGARRHVLDQILVDAAVEAGAELREHFHVDELLRVNGRVTGIRGRDAGGDAVEAHARIVIGADGKHSGVARAVGAQEYNTKPALSGGYYSYWSGVPMGDEARVYLRERRGIVVQETNDGRTMIAVQFPIGDFHAFREDIEENFQAALDLVPEFAARVAAGSREERIIGTADLRNFFRLPHGPGWALAGDAGYHRDPTLAQGISDAFRDADNLSAALGCVWRGEATELAALSAYHRERDEAVGAMYELVTQMAPLDPPPPEMMQVLGALAGNQAQIDRYIGVIAGSVPVAEFFNPENFAQILTAAASVGTSEGAVAA